MLRNLFAALLWGVGSTAGATIIDFSTVGALAGENLFAVGTSYSESGFQLTLSGDSFATIGSARAEYSGQPALVVNIGAGVTRTVTLSAISGNPFDVASIDLARWFTNTTKSVTFTGNLLGGGTVVQSFSFPASPPSFAFSTHLFPGTFANLESLLWNTVTTGAVVLGTYNYHQFDNIVVTEQAIPEPSTWGLMLVAAMALGAAAWRKSSL